MNLKTKLKEYKLSGIYNNIDERLSYAKQKSLSYTEFLELILEDEENSRRDNSYKKRYIQAKLPSHKTFEDFDFNFQKIDMKILNDAQTCQYISEHKNIIFIGNPGTGKTHLSIALAIKAIQKGYKTLFTQVSEMLHNLHISKADNSYYKKLAYYIQPNLLILDELGFAPIPNYSVHDFFEVISRRYEKGSTIITTNKSLDHWNEILSDEILISAIQDRIIHHSITFRLSGQSYRSRGIKK